jgi:hypothetical protein
VDLDINAHEADINERGVAVVSEIEPEEVGRALRESDRFRAFLPNQVYRAIASWAEEPQGASRRTRSLFQRDKFVTPGKIFEQMAMAYDALDDDIVGAVADTSEAMTFQKVTFECEDKEQEDVWNQIGRDLDLDTWVRQAWRELFITSQFYGVRYWGSKTYKVRGKKEERASRKSYDLFVPTNFGLLDPTRVVPVKNNLFGQAELCWIATDGEMQLYGEVEEGIQNDELVRSLFLGRYEPTASERATFGREDIPVDNLMRLNPDYVFRHTLTKSPFERWSRLRMKGIFPLLDLKHQLREMDRAWLLGGINFLVLVTRGSDQIPTNRQEVADTTTQMRTSSKSPVIVSDHRINIEIITPDVQHVLNQDKWAVLDERIMMRLWGTFQLPSETSNRETSVTLGKVIARGLQNRRHMLKRTLEKELIRVVTDHPLNEKFDKDAKIEFAPRRMEIEMDEALITVLQELRDRGDLSRETLLREFNFDQDLEAQRREYEDDKYEKIFKPVQVPFDAPGKTGVTPGGAGRTGGRPAGKPAPNDKKAAEKREAAEEE